jgi:2-polyprenyl-6-methoxyphenol hydroxylase-like FAD-dependent oxidoreductase
MPDQRIDALIVGAGPVGLTLAAALTHHGLRCRIVDKCAAPSDKSKALVVWSRTLELLDGLGLADTFVQTGMKAKGASMYANGQRLVHIELAGVDSPYGFPLMIPQNQTERLLTEHLAGKGVTIERQVELTSFDQTPNAVLCKLKHGDGREESVEAAWLLGCDGAHSTVRHTLGMPFTGHGEPNDWILADMHLAGPIPNDEVTIYWHAKGVLVFFPITRDRFRMIADIGKAAEHGNPPEPTLADAQAKVDERGPGGITLRDPVWLANFRINERKVTDYRRGRAMLAGDAAHIHSPAGGQGMNTGMQDAFNLAWKLGLIHRGEGQIEPLLDSYSKERSAVGDQVLKAAGTLTTMATLRNPVAQFARNHIAPIVTSFGFVQDKIKNQMTELSINYEGGPLSAEKWPWLAGGLKAGDRMPDVPLTDATGSPTTLFASIRGDRHRLLLFVNDPKASAELVLICDEAMRAFPNVLSPHIVLKAGASPPGYDRPWPVWLDVENKLHQKLGVSGAALVLVRPDGYIGYRCQPADGAALMAYLSGYLVRK